MKKTIWLPLVLGIIFGSLAGISIVTGFMFLTPGLTTNAIGFYGIFLLLSASLGGPLAGFIASTVMITISALFGTPEIKAIISIPEIFWANVLAVGSLYSLAGIGYRLIFERLKLPGRLLPWAGIVIAYYLFNSPTSIILQNLFLGDSLSGVLAEVLYSYQTYISQVIFDFLITSLIFIALPARYLKPLWYTPKKMLVQNKEVQINRNEGTS